VGVFVGQGASEIIEIMEEAGLDLAQFHGGQTPADARRVGPGRVVRAVWPERHPDPASLERELAPWREVSRLLLFDAGVAGGGHGRPAAAGGPWFLAHAGMPSLLAGGLGPRTLAALPDLSGYGWLAGFDVNSGVESSPGIKDRGLMAEAARLVKRLPAGCPGPGREALRDPRRPAGGS
jgi:phosphoribosylanthranilate isomerase